MKGQALVLLLVLMALAITITVAAVAVIVSNTSAASKFELGTVTAQSAESGAELGLVKLLRDPNYIGENFTQDDASVTVEVVSTDGIKTLTSTAQMNQFTKSVQIVVNYPVDGSMTITSWKEVY